MDAIELVKELARRTGAALAPDASGACSFEADGMAVEIVPLPELDSVALSGDLGEPPPENIASLHRMMLEANHNFTATFGATLSQDGATGRFALAKVLPLKAHDGESFVAEVERFLNVQETWAKIVRDWRDIPMAGDAGGSRFRSTDNGADAQVRVPPAFGSPGFMAV